MLYCYLISIEMSNRAFNCAGSAAAPLFFSTVHGATSLSACARGRVHVMVGMAGMSQRPYTHVSDAVSPGSHS